MSETRTPDDRSDGEIENQARKVVRENEKFNVPVQTEDEEAESFENAQVEHLADNSKIMRKKEGAD